MRRIRLEAPSHRAWSRWILACEKETRSLEAAILAGSAIAFRDGLHRRKSIRQRYFFSKGAPFFGKCAYCESPLELIDGDVDHFRPRALYPWLAYFWKNLLPCCKTCNQIYKGAQFPVEGNPASSAAELGAEKPQLINPASEDPEDEPAKNFRVDDYGMIAGRSPRGATTIGVLGLDRDELQKRRRAAYFEAKALWARRREAKAKEDIQAILEGRRPYHLVQRATLVALAARTGKSL